MPSSGDSNSDATGFTLHRQLLNLASGTKKNYVRMGAVLYGLRANEEYKNGIGETTWADYVSQPEIGLSVSEASRLIQIYETFCLKFGYDEDKVAAVTLKNLHRLLPLAKEMKSAEDVEGLLADATALTVRDFTERIYDIKSGDIDDRTFKYVLMERCDQTGTLRKVHQIPHETIAERLRDLLNA